MSKTVFQIHEEIDNVKMPHRTGSMRWQFYSLGTDLNPGNKKVVRAYIGVKSNNKDESLTNEEQLLAIKEFCDKNNYHVASLYYDGDICCEDEDNGNFNRRLGLTKLIEEIKTDEIFLCMNMECLYQNVKRDNIFINMLEDKKCKMLIIDLNGNNDVIEYNKFNYNIYSIFIADERKLRNKRVLRIEERKNLMIETQ